MIDGGYSFQFNGYTLQDQDSIDNSSGIAIEAIDGLSRVPTRISDDNITGSDGGNIWNILRGMRTISITGSLFDDDLTSYYEKRNAIAQAFTLLSTYSELIITRSDGEQKAIDAKVVQLPEFSETTGEKGDCTFNIQLRTGDPSFRDLSETTKTMIPVVIGGTPVPSPVASPVGVTLNIISTINSGDIETIPNYQIYGQCTNPTIKNLTTGEFFTIETTIPDGSILFITTTNGITEIRLNNSVSGASYYEYLRGDIFGLATGTNNLILQVSSANSNAKVVMSYFNKYQSI